MNDHSWFRLLVRALGLLVAGVSVPSLVRGISSFAWAVFNQTQFAGQRASYLIFYASDMVGGMLQLLLGIYLLFFADAFIRRCLLDIRDRCPTCQYDLRGITAPTCPECGEQVLTKPAPTPTPNSTTL